MTKLNIRDTGFTIGSRIAESLALSYVPGNKTQEYMLHSVKNIAIIDSGLASIGTCFVNHQRYVIDLSLVKGA